MRNAAFLFPLPSLPFGEEAQGRRMGRRERRIKLSLAGNEDSAKPAMTRDGKDVIHF